MENNRKELELYSSSIEAAVLSAIMFDETSMDTVMYSLTPKDFYIPGHSNIYKIMMQLSEDGLPIDESFIIKELKKIDSNAENNIIEIMSTTPVSAIEKYIDRLREYTQKRILFDLSISIRKKLEEDINTTELLVSVTDDIDTLQSGMLSNSNSRDMPDIIDEIEADMEMARSGEKLPYFKTGYVNFDSYVGGFVENGLTIVAGRPSMGKSSFTSSPIVSTIERGEGVVLYSMEVADKNALLRLISFRSDEPLSSLKVGMLNSIERYNSTKDFFISANSLFTIVDRSGMSRKDLELDIIKRIKANPLINTIIVDHLLQMYIDDKKHSPTELGNITKMLKRLSQNYKLTIVLLSQLNRGLESRDNKRPMMADLQGSGSIEQDADMIVFLYRPEYYREKEWNSEENGEYIRPEIEHAEAIVGKNRDGPTGSVELGFKSKTASFVNDHQPIDEIEYVDDNIDENMGYKASTKDSEDIIHTDIEETTNVQMPLI